MEEKRMELYGQVVTDADEIFTYFEVIRQLSPSRILDVGMMLKRMGALSRQAMHCEVPKTARLDGIDLYPKVELPIYETVYDHIYPPGQPPQEKYDLSICIGMGDALRQWMLDAHNLEYLSTHASVVLFHADIKTAVDYFKSRFPCQLLRSEGRAFILVHPARV